MINYIRELKRSVHDIKIAGDDHGGYKPHVVIINPRILRTSVMIPEDVFWKYIDPKDNRDVRELDERYFNEAVAALESKITLMKFAGGAMTAEERKNLEMEIKAVTFAQVITKHSEFLRSTAYSIAIYLQVLDVPFCDQAAFQLFNFIQDGIEEMKNRKPVEPDDVLGYAGEVTVFEGGRKVGSQDIEITETQAIEEGLVDEEGRIH